MRRALLVLPLLLVVACSDDGADGDGAAGGTDVTVPGVVAVDVGENGHTTDDVTYSVDPPAGGQHDPSWLACGAYDEPVRDENAVHALEHGVAWITYGPLDEAAVDGLEQRTSSGRVIVSPHPSLGEGEVVVSSWGRQLRLDGPDDARLDDFLDAFVDSPDAPEPGASCR